MILILGGIKVQLGETRRDGIALNDDGRIMVRAATEAKCVTRSKRSVIAVHFAFI